MSRADFLRTAKQHLMADVRMYTTEEGGRKGPAFPGWGCPCMVSQMQPFVGRDGFPILGDEPLLPGDRKRLGFYFMAGEEAAEVMRTAGRFYLWEGHFIGEATVLPEQDGGQ